jgi:hypothetical protein
MEERIDIIDNINKVGNIELGKRIKAMTFEEQCIVAENLPYDIMLDAIGRRFAKYEELEEGILDIIARAQG